MGLFESLPNKPLKRSQIGELERMDAVQGTHTIYNDLDRDTAHGIVILLNGTLRAWAYSEESSEWVELDEMDVELNEDGNLEDDELIEEFEETIMTEIGAVSV